MRRIVNFVWFVVSVRASRSAGPVGRARTPGEWRTPAVKKYPIFQYQPAQGCCVPYALINGLMTLFDHHQLPTTVIRAIYRHSLDQAGSGRTGSAAMDCIANEIDRLGCRLGPRNEGFCCSARYLVREEVSLAEAGPIAEAFRRGGFAVLLLTWPRSVRHAVTALSMDREGVYCFDPLYRRRHPNYRGCRFLGRPGSVRGPNLKIQRTWLEETRPNRFYTLGPIRGRRAIVVEP